MPAVTVKAGWSEEAVAGREAGPAVVIIWAGRFGDGIAEANWRSASS